MLKTIDEPTNARSRRTRAALLAAAREILEEKGFEALTMTAVADRSKVTRRAAYLHFATRAELVAALFDHVAGAEGLDESLQRVWDAPDAVSALDEWAGHLARYHPKVLPVDRAVQQVWRLDPDARVHRKKVVSAKLSNCRRLIGDLDSEGLLSPAWTVRAATDMLFGLISSDLIEALLNDRRWSQQRLADHLALLFRSTFVAQPAKTR
jgi:AcrR family transcriptional regulator